MEYRNCFGGRKQKKVYVHVQAASDSGYVIYNIYAMLYILGDVSCLKASSHNSAGPAALHIVKLMLAGFSWDTGNKFQFTFFSL